MLEQGAFPMNAVVLFDPASESPRLDVQHVSDSVDRTMAVIRSRSSESLHGPFGNPASSSLSVVSNVRQPHLLAR